MKILYLANIRLPTEKAHGLQIIKTCEALAIAGAEVELIVPKRKTPIAEDPFRYYGVHENFTLTKVSCPDLVRFGRIGFTLSSLWFSERAHLRRSFWKADVIYSRDAFVLLQYLLLGRKLVYEAHAAPSFISRVLARRAYRTIVISEALKSAYEAVGVRPERLVLAPDAVGTDYFKAQGKQEMRTALQLPPDAKVVVYTGHLYARKGADTLAQAASLVPDALFVFVGGTKPYVEQFRARWGSVSTIRVVGHVPPTLVPQYLHAADVVVIPNSGVNADARVFTSPMKLFEYMASGTPIVASDVPAIREIVGDEEACFFSPDDPAALAASIQSVLANPSDAFARVARAKQKAEEYTWDKRAERILASLA